MRRTVLLLTLLCAFGSAAAQNRPKNLEPLPDVPPPPTVQQTDPALEPQVTIVQRADAKVEEYRIRGVLYMMKVTPKVGPPYYLVDERGEGQFIRHDSLDSGLRVPHWVILRF